MADHKRYRQWGRGRDETVKGSPAYMMAGFLHVLLLAALSFWTVSVHFEREVLPVEVTISREKRVVPVSAGTSESEVLDALLDATQRDLEAINQADTDDPYQEASGGEAGELKLFGAGSGAHSGLGRGGARDRRGGASRASEGALLGGLDYLFRHRTQSGGWAVINDTHTLVEGEPSPFTAFDAARTGLALLCFLCADHGPEKAGPYQEAVIKARDLLVGLVGPRGRMTSVDGKPTGRRRVWQYAYHHAIVSLALSECLARKSTPELEKAVQRMVRYTLNQQTELGWRYGYGRPDTDTSVTSWMILALKSAEHAGVDVPQSSYARVRTWLKSVSNEDGTTSYTRQGRTTPAMNATGLFLRVLLGERPAKTINQRAARRVGASSLDIQSGKIGNFYHLYYAALAMYQVGGKLWKDFNGRVRDGLVSTQRRGSGCERGSWEGAGYVSDPVLATCFATLTLETYYRYLPVHSGPGRGGEAAQISMSEGERVLGLAEVSFERARAKGAERETVLVAVAAYARALRALRKEKASWNLESTARLRLIELAALADEREVLRKHVGDYLAALPAGRVADARVLRIKQLDRYRSMHARLLAASKPEARVDVEALEREARALTEEFQRDLDRAGAWSQERKELKGLIDSLAEMRLRVAFASDPERAIRVGWERIARTKAQGPIGGEEHQVVLALLLHALERFEKAVGEGSGGEPGSKSALREGEDALIRLDQRQVGARLNEHQRGQLQALRERARLAQLVALLKHRRLAHAAREAQSFVRRFGRSELRERALGVERNALILLLREDRIEPEQRQRLGVLLRDYSKRARGLSPSESLGLAHLLEAAGELALADQRFADVGKAAVELRSSAQVGRARVARLQGQLERASRALDEIEGGDRDRLDVLLERCQLWRAQGRADDALKEYLELLRVLSRTEQRAPWWEIAYQVALVYREQQRPKSAANFLEDLRAKDRSFGGDPRVRTRFLELMRALELERQR